MWVVVVRVWLQNLGAPVLFVPLRRRLDTLLELLFLDSVPKWAKCVFCFVFQSQYMPLDITLPPLFLTLSKSSFIQLHLNTHFSEQAYSQARCCVESEYATPRRVAWAEESFWAEDNEKQQIAEKLSELLFAYKQITSSHLCRGLLFPNEEQDHSEMLIPQRLLASRHDTTEGLLWYFSPSSISFPSPICKDSP